MTLPELHLLQAAVVLSETRNYSRAAKKLGIQQPTLTKWILELEHLLGVQLFLRSTQFVEPTDACRQLVEEAKQCVFHAQRAVHVAHLAERGAQTVLQIGKSQYTDPYLISMLNTISLPLFPNLKVVLSSMSTSELENEILSGRLDLALTIGTFDSPKITELELMQTPFYLLVSEDSELAKGAEVTLNQLHSKTWVLFERHVHVTLYEAILAAAAREAVRPSAVLHVQTAEEAAQELYGRLADVAFLTQAGAWRVARNGLTMRPLKHADLSLSSKLVARASDASRAVGEFTRAFKKKLEASQRVQLDLELKIKLPS